MNEVFCNTRRAGTNCAQLNQSPATPITTGMINSCIHSQPLLWPNSVHCQNLPRRVFGLCSSSSRASCLGRCCSPFSIKYLSTLVPLRYRLQTAKPSGTSANVETGHLLLAFCRQGERHLAHVL